MEVAGGCVVYQPWITQTNVTSHQRMMNLVFAKYPFPLLGRRKSFLMCFDSFIELSHENVRIVPWAAASHTHTHTHTRARARTRTHTHTHAHTQFSSPFHLCVRHVSLSCSGALYRSSILYMLPMSVHRASLNAFQGKTKFKTLHPGQ
jgi:hypothetical protein